MRKDHRFEGLPIVEPTAAGIDIGSRFHVVAVNPALSEEPVRTFQAFTNALELMADWLIVEVDGFPRETVRQSVFTYLETYYNKKRRHSTLGYKTPQEFEDQSKNRKERLAA